MTKKRAHLNFAFHFNGLDFPLKNELKAYAKINLHLEVLNKRIDGYHNILSLMANVGIYDLLKLEEFRLSSSNEAGPEIIIVNSGGRFASITDTIVTGENLVSKAANAYLSKAGISGRFVFSLEKNIPAGAGLGGGSSDAASALKLLNNAFGKFDGKTLSGIASKVGADVPFCLNSVPAICEGIGDIIEPLHGSLKSRVLVVNDGTHVNTSEAYSSLARTDEYRGELISEKKEKIRKAFAISDFSEISGFLRNDFEKPVFLEYPQIKDLKNEMKKTGAFFSAMTGSGSTVFGLFENDDEAEAARLYFDGKAATVILTEFV